MGPTIRDEEPPGDDVVVVRGGLNSLASEKVREVCEDTLADSGFYGLSVFAALDGDVRRLCERVPRLRSPGTIWVATCGQLRRRGVALLPTDAQPHFDILLPDLEPGTIEALVACFTRIDNPAKQR
jgi:hypothetical protein